MKKSHSVAQEPPKKNLRRIPGSWISNKQKYRKDWIRIGWRGPKAWRNRQWLPGRRALDQHDHNTDKGAASALTPDGVHVEWAALLLQMAVKGKRCLEAGLEVRVTQLSRLEQVMASPEVFSHLTGTQNYCTRIKARVTAGQDFLDRDQVSELQINFKRQHDHHQKVKLF